jgi:Serine proteases of the peptidase family S9A
MKINQYPTTKKLEHKDVYFGTEVNDPYIWLEDDHAKETAEWVKEQNNLTFDYLSNIPYRNNMKEALTAMWNFPKETTPWQHKGKYFVYKNNGLQNQSVLYVKDSLDGEERVLIDPNAMAADGTVSLSFTQPSKDGKYFAYQISTGGSDWGEIHVKTIDGEDLSDVIKWVKHSGFSWYKDGFYYGGYEEPKSNVLSGKNENQKVYYHKLGTKQEEDILIYENKEAPQRRFSPWVSDNEKYIILTVSEGTSGNMILFRAIEQLVDTFTTLIDNFDSDYHIVENIDDDFYFHTNSDAANGKLVKFNAKYDEIYFKDVISEKDDVLQSVSFVGEKIIAEYLHNASSRLSIFSRNGTYETDIALPSYGTVSAINGDKDSNEVFYAFTSYTIPNDIFRFDVSTLEQELYKKIELAFQASKYICDQVFYLSKDGTMVPMFITYKEGMARDGNNPLLLYGYGGFNISLTPSFSVSRMLFLENGGIYVEANLRGGGEFGVKWHEAGTKLNKQNVFDDFIAAAEYLIKEKYTSPAKLAIKGGSNGGLLVGACMTQRPDLFGVALPAVGVLDMLKYHKFTIGSAWKVDYGSSENKEEFNYLLGYSPLHNVMEGTSYPATLITTGDHDDRVVPAHSFKFAAELQAKQNGNNPILIRIETMAGHGFGKPLSKQIDELADEWAFTFYNLNHPYTNPITQVCFENPSSNENR